MIVVMTFGSPFSTECQGATLALSPVEPTEIQLPLRVGHDIETYFHSVEQACHAAYDHSVYGLCAAVDGCDVTSQCHNEPWGWHILPDGLLWHSYLAGPHEPRISTVIFNDSDNGAFWDVTIGGRMGLLRYGTFGSRRPHGWQWDIEGAVITRLDLQESEDVESMDYRFGTEITTAQGRWSGKFGYFHVSSHVGDEYMIRNPLFQRVNYVAESLVLGLSYMAMDQLRLYGETAYAMRTSGGADRWQFQTGFEYVAKERIPGQGSPFTAMNVDFGEGVDYEPSLVLQAGWSWQSHESERRFRLGLQYAYGPTSQLEFFQRREEYFGVGFWVDY